MVILLTNIWLETNQSAWRYNKNHIILRPKVMSEEFLSIIQDPENRLESLDQKYVIGGEFKIKCI